MKLNMSVELGEKEVKEVIKEYLERTTGKQVLSVSIDVSNECQGYGQGEHDVPVFRNVTAKLVDRDPNVV